MGGRRRGKAGREVDACRREGQRPRRGLRESIWQKQLRALARIWGAAGQGGGQQERFVG